MTELADAVGKSEVGVEVLGERIEDQRIPQPQYSERLPYLTRASTKAENGKENSTSLSYPLPDFTLP